MLLNEVILEEAKKAIAQNLMEFTYGGLHFFLIEKEHYTRKKGEICSFFTYKDIRWAIYQAGDE